jgi:hypothetical protein
VEGEKTNNNLFFYAPPTETGDEKQNSGKSFIISTFCINQERQEREKAKRITE